MERINDGKTAEENNKIDGRRQRERERATDLTERVIYNRHPDDSHVTTRMLFRFIADSRSGASAVTITRPTNEIVVCASTFSHYHKHGRNGFRVFTVRESRHVTHNQRLITNQSRFVCYIFKRSISTLTFHLPHPKLFTNSDGNLRGSSNINILQNFKKQKYHQ